NLVVENYYSQQTLPADPAALHTLDRCAKWRRADEFAAHGTWFRRLVRHGMLVAEGSPEAKQDALLQSTWVDWLPSAGFHFATKDTPFLSTRQALKFNKALLTESPPPRPFKSYSKVKQVK